MSRLGFAACALLLIAGGGPAAASRQSPVGAAKLDVAARSLPRQITQSGHGAYEASLAAVGDGFAVAWYDTRDGHPEIYSRRLDKAGEPAGPERRLTTGTARAYEPAIAAVGTNLAVAWYEVSDNRTSHAMLGLWSSDGQRLWTKTLALPERISKNPVVRATRNEIFCAWLTENAARDFEVDAAWFDTRGNPIAPAQRLGPAGPTTWNVNATIDDRGRAWVVYDARVSTRAEELFLVRVGKSGSRAMPLTSDDGRASTYPDLAVAGGRVALTWVDERDGNKEVYLFVAREEELIEGMEQRATRVTDTPGESIGAYLAWNTKRHRFGLAWCDNTEGQHEVYFQSFDERGRPSEPVRRITVNQTDSMIPAIMPSGDGFALAWNESTRASGDDRQLDQGLSEIAFALLH